MTLLDYPGKVACIVFTGGCNLRCPFCHNGSLVKKPIANGNIFHEVMEYLRRRKGIMDGVVITGGEPLLQPDLADFIAKVKAMGYLVKLDTNGTNPQMLKNLINDGLIDYVAMDVKNCLRDYGKTVGINNFDTTPIKESVAFLINGNVDFEFRTTVVRELHTIEGIKTLSKEIKGAPRYFLQSFVDSGDLIGENLSGYDREILEEMADAAKETLDIVEIRGI